jgi:hypothetical protein
MQMTRQRVNTEYGLSARAEHLVGWAYDSDEGSGDDSGEGVEEVAPVDTGRKTLTQQLAERAWRERVAGGSEAGPSKRKQRESSSEYEPTTDEWDTDYREYLEELRDEESEREARPAKKRKVARSGKGQELGPSKEPGTSRGKGKEKAQPEAGASAGGRVNPPRRNKVKIGGPLKCERCEALGIECEQDPR